jgi:hypothetical protein
MFVQPGNDRCLRHWPMTAGAIICN